MENKKLLSLLLALCCAVVASAKNPKYVFYFISDGTGVNIVQGAEHYRADIKAFPVAEGVEMVNANAPFLFSQFPVVGMATTYSASSRVTDSAASGTALATGHKTDNGCISVLSDKKTPVYSIAKAAKQLGMAVGVATSVTVNHATPAAFYANAASRSSYHEIGHQLVDCDFVDFFGGSAIAKASSDKCDMEKSLYDVAVAKGFAVCRGAAEYDKKAASAKKMLLIQPEGQDDNSLSYVIDRKPGDMTIEEIVERELDFLVKKDNGKGFFLMNEIGGKVDWADHSKDAATAFAELEAVNRCVEIAYKFYQQHPDETLIVLTSDHDTGGPSLGNGKYEMNLNALQSQKISKDKYTDFLNDLRKKNDNNVTWEQVRQSLEELWGFWTVHKLTEKQEKLLKDTYEKAFNSAEGKKTEKSEYKSNDIMSSVACSVLSQIAMIQYAHGTHTGGYVPVYAVGVGADEFKSMNDNTTIPRKLASIIGAKM